MSFALSCECMDGLIPFPDRPEYSTALSAVHNGKICKGCMVVVGDQRSDERCLDCVASERDILAWQTCRYQTRERIR